MKKNSCLFILFLLSLSKAHTTPSLETAIKYQQNEQFTDAIACYQEIIQNEPDNIEAIFKLGACYLSVGKGERAIAIFNNIIRALPLSPNALSALYNTAFSYNTIGDLDTAIQLYKQIIQINPEFEQAQFALGCAYLAQGNFKLGWQQHQRYLMQSGKNGDTLRSLLSNNNIAHKKIVLRPEGGLGDTLNFIRYAERLKNMGANIVVGCQEPLIPLLSRCTYIDQLLPCHMPLPEHDADATLMSLPAIFNDNDTTIPNKIPYLFADPTLITHWQKQLSSDTNFKIGICWQADINNDIPSKLPIARRGVPLQSFAQLGTINGVSFYSLQKYDGIEQLTTLSSDFQLHVFDDFDEKSGPFMDTAALIKNLDLVITVDTAVAHLAGGLGAKVWLLLPYATADWRWICHRTDSYWYPQLRIFKQQKPFDYDGVIKEVHAALQELIKQKKEVL